MFSYKLFKSIKIDRLIKYFYSKLDKMKDQRNWVFVTNSYFLIIVSLQPNVVYRRRVLDILNLNSGRSNNLSLKYQRFTPSSSTDIGIRKLKVVEKLNSFLQFSVSQLYNSILLKIYSSTEISALHSCLTVKLYSLFLRWSNQKNIVFKFCLFFSFFSVSRRKADKVNI